MSTVESSQSKGLRRALQDMRADVCKLIGYIDLRDMLGFGGLAMLGYGISLVYAPAAWIVCGAALFWIGKPR